MEDFQTLSVAYASLSSSRPTKPLPMGSTWRPMGTSNSHPNFPQVSCCFIPFSSVQFSSVAQSCQTLCNPMDFTMLGFPVHRQLPEFTQTQVHRVGHPLFLPSIFPSIRVFSNESALHITWTKYWSFSKASVLPMNTQD